MGGQTKTKRFCPDDRLVTGGVTCDDAICDVSDVDGGSGRWESLSPEILALIFVRIPLEQLFKHVLVVCKSWLEAIAGPYCWTEIDVEDWCRDRRDRPGGIDSAVRKLVRRSRGTFRRLSAYKLGIPGFSFVANSGRCLKVLQIPMSDVTDKIVKRHAESLSNVTVLDISNCLKITCKGLEALGKHCKALIHLRRNMPPPDWLPGTCSVALKVDDREAMVIANTMPGLHHLELGYGCFTEFGLDAILNKCKALTHLDIQGCRNVKLQGDLLERCEQLKVFKSPDDDEYENNDSSDSNNEGAEAGDDSSSSDSD